MTPIAPAATCITKQPSTERSSAPSHRAAREEELATERAHRDPRLARPAQSANLHQKTLEALLGAWAKNQGLTGHEIALQIGKAGVADHISALRKHGYQIRNVRQDGTFKYVLDSPFPQKVEPLPNLPMPTRQAIDAQREADGLPSHACDFCLVPESPNVQLQREHGHPARYFGTTEATRWLLACAACNTRKRSSCETCPNRDPKLRRRTRCDDCTLGNPRSIDASHTAGRPLIIFSASTLGQRSAAALRERAAATGTSVEEALARALSIA